MHEIVALHFEVLVCKIREVLMVLKNAVYGKNSNGCTMYILKWCDNSFSLCCVISVYNGNKLPPS